MLARTVSALLCILMLLVAGSECVRSDAKNSTARKREKADLGTKDFSGESQFTGEVAFAVPIASAGGVDVSLRYSSNVCKLIPADNRFSSPGWVGLGWKLNLGSIQADNNNTADKRDDKYFYAGPDAVSELILDTDTLDQFVMREYRHWKITRQVSGGTVVGWTVITEDGTIYRYGNFDRTTGQFNLDSLHATRYSVASGGLVQTTLASGGIAQLVPYEWDLSDIEDVNGDHTTIKYQQVKQTLAGTNLLATAESYPREIVERNGRKVEFVLFDNPLLYLDSPLVGTGQVRRETRSLRRVLTRDKQGNVVSGVEFAFDTMNVLNRTSQFNKKTFLKTILDLDRSLNVVKTTSFEYAGVTAALDTGDHNPGALTVITLPEGGTIRYKYSKQVVIEDRGARIVTGKTLWSSHGTGRLATDIEYWSMSGTDFFVVWQSGYLTAYRWAPDNSYHVDGEFPLNGVKQQASSAYWVQNDYVACLHSGYVTVAKREGEKWRLDTVEAGVYSALSMLGLGSDYFVYAIGCTIDGNYPQYGGVRVATFSNTRKWSLQDLGWKYIANPNRIICGNRVFASGGSIPTYVYNGSTGLWEDKGNAAGFSAAGPDYLLRKGSIPTVFEIIKWNGSSWATAQLLDPPYVDGGASFSPGNNFFLITATNGQGDPVGVYVATNTVDGWRSMPLGDIFPSAIVGLYTRVAVGPDFFVVSWRDPNQPLWKLGVVRYRSGQWQQGQIVASLPATTFLNQRLTPVVSGSTIFTEIHRTGHMLQVNSFTLRNEAWDVQELMTLYLGYPINEQNLLKPFMQPGENFTVCLYDSSSVRDNDGTLFAWKRSYGSSFREAYCDTIPAGLAFPIASKTYSDGIGNSSATRYEFSHGSFDDDIRSARFNKSVVLPPGSNGRTTTYRYNDLGPGEVEDFQPNNDFKLLDGQTYREIVIDNTWAQVRRESSSWTATLPGSYIDYKYLVPIATEDPGLWTTDPSGEELHNVIDDGVTGNPSDYGSASFDGDMFTVRMGAPGGTIAPNGNIVMTMDIRSDSPDRVVSVPVALCAGDGLWAVKDTTIHLPLNSEFNTYHMTVSLDYVTDPSRLFVQLETASGLASVSRILCECPVRVDRGVAYARLTRSDSWHDGVPSTTLDEYSDTNGLIKKRTETNSSGTERITETTYAYERGSYAAMGSSKHMYSQVYATTVKAGTSDVEARKWTIWGNPDGVWRPREEWVWRGDGSANDQTAPADPEGNSEALKVSTIVSYDAHGNPRQVTDASGINSATVYGYDSTLAIGTFKNATASTAFATVFDDSILAGWTATYGTWAIQNGVYRQTDGAQTGSWTTPTKNTLVQIDDGVVEADIRFDNAGSYRYVMLAKVVDGTSYLRFECRKSESVARIHAMAPGSNIYQDRPFTFDENRWYHVRGEIQGQTARLYIDGKKVVELTAAQVDRPAGYLGLGTFGTVASFDNVRYSPVGSLASIQAYDRVSNLPVGASDENGLLQSTVYDPANRRSKLYVRAEGKNLLASEMRYTYGRATGDVFEKARPNAIEILSVPDSAAVSDYANVYGWSRGSYQSIPVDSIDIAFNIPFAGETTARLGTNGSWNYILRWLTSTHTIARVDFYPTATTSGTPHVLAFESDGYRFCVQYNPSSDRFQMQTYFGGSWLSPMTFSLPAPPDRWYTIELEKTEGGEAYAFVYPKGSGRINATGYVYRCSGYPSPWLAFAISYSNTDYYYLANFYAGLPDRAVAYFDGRGRDIQTQRQLKLNSIVESSTQYDSAGRASQVYKPFEKDYSGTSRHRYDSLYTSNADAYYNALDNGDSHTSGYPYAETQYNPDPTGRVWKRSFPGTDWRMGGGHETQSTFGTNASGDTPGYSVNTLYKTSSLDEDATTTWSFVDKFGNAVASTVDPSGLNLRTTMQYDVLGSRTASVTPRGDTTRYAYDPLKRLRSKTSPDGGAVQYLYDANGNIRLVKDAAHTGTSANNVYLNSNNVSVPTLISNQFTLTMPGNVSLNARVYDIDDVEKLTIRIKANGTTIKTVETNLWSGASGNIILPKGTYTYEVQASGPAYGTFGYTISCQTGYEFVYYKYNAFGRLAESGEYESSSASANFTQANADNAAFPSSNCLISSSMRYDTESADSNAAGQRNIKGRLSMARAYRLGVLELTTSYSYNPYGLVEWTVQTNSAGRIWKQYLDYDVQGRVTKKSFLDGVSASYNLYTFYEYDQLGRLVKVSTGPNANGTSKTQEAAYMYYAGGTAKRAQLASVQGVDYRYNTRDWLTQINEQNLAAAQDPGHDGPGGSGVDSTDRFGMVIGYQYQGHIGYYQNATPRWNGNISWIMYRMLGVSVTPGTPYAPTDLVGNTYSYDKAGRILGSNFGFYSQNTGNGVWSWYGTSIYDESGYQYDASGNITAVQRYGSTGALMDNLSYTYATGTNRLRHISDAVAAGTFSSDIDNQVTDNYAYDSNGSMQKDLQRDVAFVVNDIHNLPVSMWKASTGQELKYYYDAEGKRIRKDVGSTDYYVNGPGGETEVVVKSDASGATHNILGRDNLGQVKRSGTAFARYYYLKDHLGTIKMTVNGSCNVVGYDDYYPFGQQMDLRCGAAGADGRLKYTSKERDAESGYDYFGARHYDARIGKWLSVDPLFSEYPGWTPFCYGLCDPIRRLDVGGNFSADIHASVISEARGTWYVWEYLRQLIWIDGYQSARREMHLDNFTVDELAAEISRAGGLGNLDDHTIGDFYSHSNYINLWYDYEGEDKGATVPLYTEIDWHSRFGEYVRNALRTTVWPDKADPSGEYGHDEGTKFHSKDKVREGKDAKRDQELQALAIDTYKRQLLQIVAQERQNNGSAGSDGQTFLRWSNDDHTVWQDTNRQFHLAK